MPVEFVRSAYGPAQFPRDGLPEIAFVGRSNVGKSSLLNSLMSRSGRSVPARRVDRARTSRTPGRTRAVNFFRVDGRMYFADLPGYGYARAPGDERERWKVLAESYLTGRTVIQLVVLLVDLRHGPTALDRQMKEWLDAQGQAYCVVATKSDKLKRAALLRATRSIQDSFCAAIPVSSETGAGVQQLWRAIQSALAA